MSLEEHIKLSLAQGEGSPRSVGRIAAGNDVEMRMFLSLYGGKIPELNPETMPGVMRWERIRAALQSDKVSTVGQLIHHYHATSDDLSKLAQVEHVISPVHMRGESVKVKFCALSASDLKSRPTVLAHTAATAEARMALGISPELWKASTYHEDFDYDPDALYLTEDGKKIAVEYDRGTYNRNKVVSKIQAFSRVYDGILWVVPPPIQLKDSGEFSKTSRHHNIRNMIAMNPDLQHVRSNILVMTVKWWHGAEILQQ